MKKHLKIVQKDEPEEITQPIDFSEIDEEMETAHVFASIFLALATVAVCVLGYLACR